VKYYLLSGTPKGMGRQGKKKYEKQKKGKKIMAFRKNGNGFQK
jgi:hypothetical protein